MSLNGDLLTTSRARRMVSQNERIFCTAAVNLPGDFPMTVLRSQLPPEAGVSAEFRHALKLLAHSPRGITEDVLELGHGVSCKTLAMLTLAGLATMVTETLRANDATFKIERVRITDAGRYAIEVERRLRPVRPKERRRSGRRWPVV
jgi:hypothetical protein